MTILIIVFIMIAIVCIAGYVYSVKFYNPQQDPEQNVGQITRDKFSPEMNRFAARKETTVSEARGKLAETLNTETTNVGNLYDSKIQAREKRIGYENTPRRMTRQEELDEAAHRTQLIAQERTIAETQLHLAMLEQAKAYGLPYATFEAMMNAKVLNEQEVIKLADEFRIDLESGFIYELREYHKLLMMRGKIDALILEIDQIKVNPNLSDSAKIRQIAERELDIITLQKDRDARREKILQIDNRPRLAGGSPPTNV